MQQQFRGLIIPPFDRNSKGKEMATKALAEHTKEELIQMVCHLKECKKFGLVWENKPEKVTKDCQEKLPILKEITSKAIELDKTQPTNIIIEGDNYHALSVLNYTHAGKIDVIYIDPPYNTGNKDFVYNDKIVDSEDCYRHSKWLSFMENRLSLAKNLLSEEGVIFISIDDNEYAHLKLLCDELFGEENFQCNIVWRIGWLSGFKTAAPKFIRNHDYHVMYSKNSQRFRFNKTYIYNKDFKPLIKDTKEVREKMSEFGLTRIQQKEFLQFINHDNRPERYPIEDTWNCNEYDDSNSIAIVSFSGEKVSKMIGAEKDFEGQKSSSVIKRIVNSIPNKNAIVLDFFAGSGTTGQAVLELNKSDGGKRQFILCTNNENQIAEQITYPRIKTVITGTRPDGSTYSDGISANVRYFKTDFVSKNKTNDKLRREIAPLCTDMIKIRENCFETVIYTDQLKVLKNARGLTVLVFDDGDLSPYIQEIEKLETNAPVFLYVFSYNNDNRDYEIPTNTKHKYKSQPIPEGVLSVYRRIFQPKGN